MRIKGRHLLIRVVYEDQQPDPSLATPQLAKAITNATESNFGDFGTISTRFGFQIKYFNPLTGLGLIRVPRGFCDTVVYAITSMNRLNGKPAKIDILHISGTINRCQQIAIELSRQYLKDLAFTAYVQSRNDGGSSTTTSNAAVITLTSDGDIVPDPATVAQIAQIEQEIASIDAQN